MIAAELHGIVTTVIGARLSKGASVKINGDGRDPPTQFPSCRVLARSLHAKTVKAAQASCRAYWFVVIVPLVLSPAGIAIVVGSMPWQKASQAHRTGTPNVWVCSTRCQLAARRLSLNSFFVRGFGSLQWLCCFWVSAKHMCDASITTQTCSRCSSH